MLTFTQVLPPDTKTAVMDCIKYRTLLHLGLAYRATKTMLNYFGFGCSEIKYAITHCPWGILRAHLMVALPSDALEP